MQRSYAGAAAASSYDDHLTRKVLTAEKKICSYCNATILEEKRKLSLFPTQMTASVFESVLPDVDAFIFDADGVLWLGNTVIPGSPDFLRYLISKDKRAIILTNNSSRSRRYLANRLRLLNFSFLTEENIVNPAAIITDLLTKGNLLDNKYVYLIGSDGLHEELTNAGIKCFGQGSDNMHSEKFDDEEFLNENAFLFDSHFRDDVGAVIVGFEKYFNYVKLIKAANYLQNKSCLFFGTNEDETSPGPHPNTVIPDTGPILAAVKSASGREPIVVGKPHSTAFEYISKRWNLKPERTFMVGDRLTTDICFGRQNGLRTLLVLTGCHNISDISQFREHPNMLPEFYAISLGSLLSPKIEVNKLSSTSD